MTEYFVSANSRYTKEKDRYLKNGEAITNSDGNKIDETREVRNSMSQIILASLDGWGEEYEQIRQDAGIE